LDFQLQNFHRDFCRILAWRVKIGCQIRLAKMIGGCGRGAGGRALWNGLIHRTFRHGLGAPCCLPTPRSKVYLKLPSIIDTTPAPPSYFTIILSIPALRLGPRWVVLTTQGPLSLLQARHLLIQSLFEERRVDLLLGFATNYKRFFHQTIFYYHKNHFRRSFSFLKYKFCNKNG
jgi:hypothetical protein